MRTIKREGDKHREDEAQVDRKTEKQTDRETRKEAAVFSSSVEAEEETIREELVLLLLFES
jgi:hypothetical protein